jgi:NAD(P)-dependent dehydrogenase (short-subunit alcohol dehydrogenase family)
MSIGGLLTVPFNSIYHATKWALEGWSESIAFELSQFRIGIKTIPGGMKTDFSTRSLDTGRHPAYDALVNRVMGLISEVRHRLRPWEPRSRLDSSGCPVKSVYRLIKVLALWLSGPPQSRSRQHCGYMP